jgi:hypothetical protein
MRCFDLPVGAAIKCVEQGEDEHGCDGCDFNAGHEMLARECNAPEGLICGISRKDRKDIIFKLVGYRKETVGVETMRETSWSEK